MAHIRPDFSSFDANVRSSPAKASSAMHSHMIRQSSATVPGVIPIRRGSSPMLSATFPRTPTSHKKRKDSGSSLHPAAYRRELERRLLEMDHLLFQNRTSTMAHMHPHESTGEVYPIDTMPLPSGTVTLGSLLGVSSLLLSASAPRDFLFSPGISPQPSPALTGIKPPRSPIRMHAIQFLTSSPPNFSLDNSASPPGSPPPEEVAGSLAKRTFTQQHWQAQQNANAAFSGLAFPTNTVLSTTAASNNFALNGAHRRGSVSGMGSDHSMSSAGSSHGGDGSFPPSGFSSGMHSGTESGRGSFSSVMNASMNATPPILQPASTSPGTGVIMGTENLMGPPPSPYQHHSSLHLLHNLQQAALPNPSNSNGGGAPFAPQTPRRNKSLHTSLSHPGAGVGGAVTFHTAAAVGSSNHFGGGVSNFTGIQMHPAASGGSFSPHIGAFNGSPSHTQSSHSSSPYHSFLAAPSTSNNQPLPQPPPLPSSLPPPPLLSHQFDFLWKIGRGSFGEVWKVVKRTGMGSIGLGGQQQTFLLDPSVSAGVGIGVGVEQAYAIKKHFSPLATTGERRSFMRRTELMKQLVDGYNGVSSTRTTQSGPPAFSLSGMVPMQNQPHPTHASAGSGGPAAGYQWPPHLLTHHLIWQEDHLLYTLTEYCALGDLFQFFQVGERMAQRLSERAAAGQQNPGVSQPSADDDADMGVSEPVSLPSQGGFGGRSSSVAELSGQDVTSSPTSNETRVLTEEDLIQLLLQISTILSIMHGQNILHNDIKPDNIYVNARHTMQQEDPFAYPYEFKLGDLGSIASMSEWVDGDCEGDGSYLAPEVLNPTGSGTVRSANISAKIDIFALGASCYTLVTGEKFLSSVLQSDLAAANAGLAIGMPDVQTGSTTGVAGHVTAFSLPASPSQFSAPHSLVRRPSAIGTSGPDMMLVDSVHSAGVEYLTLTAHGSSYSFQVTPVTGTASAFTCASTSSSLEGLSGLREEHSDGSSSAITTASEIAPTTFLTSQGNSMSSSPIDQQPHHPPRDNELYFSSDRDMCSLSPSTQDLIRRMVSIYPSVRPTSEEIKDWAFKEINKRRMEQQQRA